MPRASNQGKRQQGAANQRDTRHENGLVGPGKRVASKKSQSQLDGSARPADSHSVGPALPSPLPYAANGNGNGNCAGNGKHPVGMALDNRSHESLRRGSLGAYSESSSTESVNSQMGNGNGMLEANHRQIDVNASKNIDVHRDSGPFELAATVLKALPLYDTLAILIILMQVPPVALSGIYMLFTFLTFVPPVTTSSGININLAEIFDWNSTMPSLVTVACMDVFILLVWLFLWPPIQHAILDLAKPVIAVTLGGGTSSREGTSRSVTTCFLLVIASHLFRSSRLHWSRAARFLPSTWNISPDTNDPLESISRGYDKRGPHGWIKSILAIHILTQGIVRYIREWYIRREKGNASSQGLLDPEAGKPETSTDTGFATPDTDANFTPNSTISSTKKRRKQSTQVRLQQPLWAALASTKIVMVKEYELSHAASESAGSNATDIHNLGNAPFDTQPEQIWISYIGYDEVCFNTSHFPATGSSRQGNGHVTQPSGVDTSKPFFVRVNKAYWQPTRILPVEDEDELDAAGTTWCGDIYGLRPLSKYVCEFVDSYTNRVIFSASIRTTQAPSRDSEGVISPPANGQQLLRPDSPATTLKSTITANNERLADEKSKLKILRKEWKSKTSALKRENERLDNMVQSAGGNDDKLRQKIQQQESLKSQADKDISQLEADLKAFETAPEGFQERKKQTEKKWAAEKAVFEVASKEFKEYQASLDGVVKSKADDQSGIQTRRSKIAVRIAKVDNELARITDANNRGLNEAERRRQRQAAWQAETVTIESNFRESISNIRGVNIHKQEQVDAAMQQLRTFHEQMNQPNALSYEMPDPQLISQQFAPNPWNPISSVPSQYSTSMWPPAATSGLGASMMPSVSATVGWGLPQPTLGPGALKARGRSSSMLSDVSGFTQSSAADDDGGSTYHHTPPVQTQLPSRGPPGFAFSRYRQGSVGGASARSSVRSGSGSGSGGSMRDPTSPT